MHKRWLYILVPFAAFFLYLAVRIPLRAMWNSLRYEDEPITKQARPRLNNMKRFLGVIIPLEGADKTWFLKFVARENEVEPLEANFLEFVHSFRFTNPEAPTWTLPQGWSEEEPKEKLRYKTIFADKDRKLEITVSSLPGRPPEESANRWREHMLADNINRWRQQLGVQPLSPFELVGFYSEIKVAGHDAYLVDMLGPGTKAKAPPMAKLPPVEQPPLKREAPFKFETPEGWKAAPGNEFSILAFLVSDKGKKASVTVSALGGGAGGLLANVNRWRGQVGLDDIDDKQLAKLALDLTVSGLAAKLVDLSGPKGRILGAIVPRGPQTYFFKMTGPGDLVGDQKNSFEAFLKSIRFE